MSGFLNAEFTNDSPSLRNIDVFWFYIMSVLMRGLMMAEIDMEFL
jgi:hypothetical protein